MPYNFQWDSAQIGNNIANLPSDSLFSQQWHLNNTTPGELDLNVVDVWPSYTGRGVSAFVIDDGFDYTHTDLAPNYDTTSDYDFEEEDDDPFGDPGDAHGTASMGILGAAENGTGVVGVAHETTLSGYRVYGFIGDRFMSQLARAIEQAATDGGDIASMSLGSQYSLNFFDQAINPTIIADLQAAIDSAADTGRSGLGTILVKSAGNGRDDGPQHNANASSWNADFKTISVAATNADGTVTSYSTPGANLLISAFGSPIPGTVVTTDRVGAAGYDPGDFTTSFNGTSAAAPMISGVVALMLEANPDLGWRDVQEILANAARQVDGSNPTWVWNAANSWNNGGFHHSVDLGFGLVDAHAAVRLAETWEKQQTTANMVEKTAGSLPAPLAIPDNDPNGVQVTITQDATVGRIEFASLRLDLPHSYAGDLIITLTSPGGTTTTLLDRQTGDADHPSSWTYTAAAFRGEAGQGTWTIKIVDAAGADLGTLNDIALTLHGEASDPDDLYVFTEAFSDVAGGSGHSTTITDSDGTGRDQINAAAITGDSHLDLEAGSGTLDGVAVTISGIEDLVTGDGDDTLYGNTADNSLRAGRGNDEISGKLGADTLRGESGTDVIQGDAGDDTLFPGTGDGDSVYGGIGNDSIIGELGNNLAWGGDDDDRISGNSGSDIAYGGNEDDRVIGGSGVDRLYGGNGSDFAYGGRGDDTISGGASNDTLKGGHDDDTLRSGSGDGDALYGGQDNDRIVGGTGAALGFGGGGDDRISGNGGNDTAYGDLGDDRLIGGSEADLLFGDHGDDYAFGGIGDDTLDGGGGSDTLHGGTGHDTLRSGSGSDNALYGGQGDDSMIGGTGSALAFGGGGDDRASGNGGDDTAYGGDSSDRLIGGDDDDFLYGDAGDDTAFGGNDTDTLKGLDGNDSLRGGGENDRLVGLSGDDDIIGGNGNDFLFGGFGFDTIFDGSGDDRMQGNFGRDTFVFHGGGHERAFGGGGNDRFEVFNPTEGTLFGGGGTKDVARFSASDVAGVTMTNSLSHIVSFKNGMILHVNSDVESIVLI